MVIVVFPLELHKALEAVLVYALNYVFNVLDLFMRKILELTRFPELADCLQQWLQNLSKMQCDYRMQGQIQNHLGQLLEVVQPIRPMPFEVVLRRQGRTQFHQLLEAHRYQLLVIRLRHYQYLY